MSHARTTFRFVGANSLKAAWSGLSGYTAGHQFLTGWYCLWWISGTCVCNCDRCYRVSLAEAYETPGFRTVAVQHSTMPVRVNGVYQSFGARLLCRHVRREAELFDQIVSGRWSDRGNVGNSGLALFELRIISSG